MRFLLGADEELEELAPVVDPWAVTNRSFTPLTNLSNVPFSTDVVVAATLETLVMLGGDQDDFSGPLPLRFGDLGSELDRDGGPLLSVLGLDDE